MNSEDAPGGGDLAAEVLEGRLANPVAATCTLNAISDLVAAIPPHLAVDPDVYAGLQRVADNAETAIGVADSTRSSLIPGDGEAGT